MSGRVICFPPFYYVTHRDDHMVYTGWRIGKIIYSLPQYMFTTKIRLATYIPIDFGAIEKWIVYVLFKVFTLSRAPLKFSIESISF